MNLNKKYFMGGQFVLWLIIGTLDTLISINLFFSINVSCDFKNFLWLMVVSSWRKMTACAVLSGILWSISTLYAGVACLGHRQTCYGDQITGWKIPGNQNMEKCKICCKLVCLCVKNIDQDICLHQTTILVK